ncbi:MAG: hypothetical protein ACYTFT_07570, partial [Planctomycetota bacterium]
MSPTATRAERKKGKSIVHVTTSSEGALPQFLFSPASSVNNRDPNENPDLLKGFVIRDGIILVFDPQAKLNTSGPTWAFRTDKTGLVVGARVCGSKEKTSPGWIRASLKNKGGRCTALAFEKLQVFPPRRKEVAPWLAGRKSGQRRKVLQKAFSDLAAADAFRPGTHFTKQRKKLEPDAPKGLSPAWHGKLFGGLMYGSDGPFEHLVKKKAPFFFVTAPAMGWVKHAGVQLKWTQTRERLWRKAMKNHGFYIRYVQLLSTIYNGVRKVNFPNGFQGAPNLGERTSTEYDRIDNESRVFHEPSAEAKAIATEKKAFDRRVKNGAKWLWSYQAPLEREARLTLSSERHLELMGTLSELLAYFPKDQKLLAKYKLADAARGLGAPAKFKAKSESLFITVFGLAYSANAGGSRVLGAANALMAFGDRELKLCEEVIEGLAGADLQRVDIKNGDAKLYRLKADQTKQKIAVSWDAAVNTLNLIAYLTSEKKKLTDHVYAGQSVIGLAEGVAKFATMSQSATQAALGIGDEFDAIKGTHGWGKAAKWLGKGAGVLGAVAKTSDLVDAIEKGDTEGAVFAGVDLSASLVMLVCSNPAVAVGAGIIMAFSGVLKQAFLMFSTNEK